MEKIIRDILWAMMVGCSFGMSVGTLLGLIKLRRRIEQCEDVLDYLAGREAGRLISECLADKDGFMAGPVRASNGPVPDAHGPHPDAHGPGPGP